MTTSGIHVRLCVRLALLIFALCGGTVAANTARAAHLNGILLFTATGTRSVTAGHTQKVWVHTMALATVGLKVDYGNGQSITQQATTDAGGIHLFQWTPLYTGTAITLAHYWVYVTRGALSTAARGDFILFPAPPLAISVKVQSATLLNGSLLHVRTHSLPHTPLILAVRSITGTMYVTRTGVADAGGLWDVSVPVSVTLKAAQRMRVEVSGTDIVGRRAVGVGFFTLQPRPIPVPLPEAPPASLAQARREARAAAAGSYSLALSNARQAVESINVDMQVLAQWTPAPPAHNIAYYQNLVANATNFDALIEATARTLADDAIVQARMRAVMPHKAIMVSLSEQALRAYQDGQLVMFTYITTGRPALPTVTGHYAIYEKVTPFEFHSPWPPGSPYYYPPTWIKYWMPFYEGYGLHDAWWRYHYGPGTNIFGDGPGSGEPTGTHGCINIPFDKTQWLWDWAPVGTPVVVYGGPQVTPGAAGI